MEQVCLQQATGGGNIFTRAGKEAVHVHTTRRDGEKNTHLTR